MIQRVTPEKIRTINDRRSRFRETRDPQVNSASGSHSLGHENNSSAGSESNSKDILNVCNRKQDNLTEIVNNSTRQSKQIKSVECEYHHYHHQCENIELKSDPKDTSNIPASNGKTNEGVETIDSVDGLILVDRDRTIAETKDSFLIDIDDEALKRIRETGQRNERDDSGNEDSDGRKITERQTNTYAAKKTVAQGMMDLALITANANQLRFIIEYTSNTSSYYLILSLIITSLLLQVIVGISLIFRGRMDLRGQSEHRHAVRINNYVVVGVFLITIINVFVASFTTIDHQTRTATPLPKINQKT